MLVRQRGTIHAPIAAGEEHVVIAWPIERVGRKRLAGAAVLSASGETLASCDALLIEPRRVEVGGTGLEPVTPSL
jgi:hypothetical protein